LGRKRPLTKVFYELEIITSDGEEVKEEFSVSYDSEFYDEDKESTDSIFITMRMADMKEKHGDDVLLLEYTVERETQVLH
jgi:hypothetical protein